MAKTELNPRQSNFCVEYVVDFVGTHACIRAGYSPRSAYSMSSKLLKDPRIRARISEIISDKLGNTKDEIRYRVVQELAQIAFHKVTDDIKIVTKYSPVFDEEGKDTGKKVSFQTVEIKDSSLMISPASISSIKQNEKGEIEVKYHDKVKALELLGRYGALFTDKLEIKDEGPKIQIYLPHNNRDDIVNGDH